jgi:hypothetical protein
MGGPRLQALVAAVQTNCHIADARHAADMTLCTYLLQMREMFRWERGLPLGATLAQAEIGAWIAQREALWDTLEDSELQPLPAWDGAAPAGSAPHAFDPFDAEAINAQLLPAGLVYGAGLVGAQRPVFFLAELHARGRSEGLDVLRAGRELARGLLAPLAALGGGEQGPVVIRRESIARACWERFEAFTSRRTTGGAFHAAVQAYALEPDFAAALPRWVDEQSEVMLLHELGEHRAGSLLGPAWAEMLLALTTRRAGLYARAVRDHVADCDVTLPTLLARGAEASLHAWFAHLDGLRAALFPALSRAYTAWCQGDRGQSLQAAASDGGAHFGALARQALALHRAQHTDATAATLAVEALLSGPAAVCSAV